MKTESKLYIKEQQYRVTAFFNINADTFTRQIKINFYKRPAAQPKKAAKAYKNVIIDYHTILLRHCQSGMRKNMCIISRITLNKNNRCPLDNPG